MLAAWFCFACAALALAPISSRAPAGPLNPPAGAIASTAKPLAEIEPRTAISAANTPGDADSVFRITQPGSYYLTGNLTGVLGKSGIEIAADRVTIDLGGFHVLGVTGSLSGITSTRSAIRIVNGFISGWDVDGVHLSTSAVGGLTVENVNSSTNAGYGIFASNGVVRGCTVANNGSNGIISAALAQGCTAVNNAGNGIGAVNGAVVENCVARDNDGDGIYAGTGSTVTGCTTRNNGVNGIIVFGNAIVSRCVSTLNTSAGINGQQATTILDCNCSDNDSHGISSQGQCYIRGNTCHGNGSAGIFVTGLTGTYVEGNTLTNNARGLWATGTNCIIIRNTASGNTTWNWDIDANNVVGPILDRTAVVSASINGNSAPSSLGSTDTNANFTY